MTTIEDTPFGRLELSWGQPNPEAALAARGIAPARARRAGSLTCKDPLHGETHDLAIAVDRAGHVFVLDEITNGVWVVGWQAPPG